MIGKKTHPSIDPPGVGPLRRSLSLPLVTLYGLGTTLGAGIYVLVGAVAGETGFYTPVAFLVASVLAGFSALSFAELSARFPQSAGEAVYVFAGLKSHQLATGVGFMVVLAGLVSSAAIVNGFVGYLHEFVEIPRAVAISGLVVVLGLISAWGINQSVGLATVVTVVEIAGLLFIMWVARDGFADLPELLPELLPPFSWSAWATIFVGATLAFYAFIGFEDMVNIAEEIKDVRTTLPIAIILTLSVTTVIYLGVSLAAILIVPPDVLRQSQAPLALVYATATGKSTILISLISIVAVLNGALIQIIMASRILYGMGTRKWIPAFLSYVHPKTQTPVISTALVTALVLVFALSSDLVTLAKFTSLITLSVFSLVNLALVVIKLRESMPPQTLRVPLIVPAIGFVASTAFAGYQLFDLLGGG